MKITKDEARILASTLKEGKYELSHIMLYSKEEANKLMSALEHLEYRLEEFGKDQRREGRKSQDSFSDLLKRYSKHYDL